MIGDGIHEDALQHLVQQSAVREFVAGRDTTRTKWTFSVRLGGPHSRLIPVRSRREAIRTWASLTAVGRFAERLGVRGLRWNYEVSRPRNWPRLLVIESVEQICPSRGFPWLRVVRQCRFRLGFMLDQPK